MIRLKQAKARIRFDQRTLINHFVLKKESLRGTQEIFKNSLERGDTVKSLSAEIGERRRSSDGVAATPLHDDPLINRARPTSIFHGTLFASRRNKSG
jgi:hypothetical protein